MRRLCRGAVLGGALVFAAAAAGPAPDAGSPLVIGGQVRHELRLSLADVRGLPAVEERVSFHAMHGERTATYRGVRLWTLLGQAGAFDPAKPPRSRVAAVLTATGRDGYTATLALAELDPAVEGKSVLIAYAADGKPVSGGGMRLVVPGDRAGGRDVRDVVRIEVRRAGSD